jgi:sigma-B regulation protein RsbU (phosphoserine phosphatase)
MTGSRILVVDDEPGMIRAVERVLSPIHHVVGTCSSSDALRLAADLKPDLAILDIRMPQLDGFELMSQLKGRLPELDVILMTGSVDDLDDKLVRAIRSPAFFFIQKPFDREVLKTLVERCLELRWRREEHHRHLKRLETEMAEAKAFQQGLLPEREAVVNRLAISCRYTPSERLGGDLYDYTSAGPGQTALLIADVSGHGVSAAMLTGIVKSAFHAAQAEGYEPHAVAHRVWTGLAAFSPDRFVTLFAALVLTSARELRYVSAGHPPVAQWGPKQAPKWLESTGPLISPVLPGSWNATTVSLDQDDQLLLYTDGISEVLAGDTEAAKDRFARIIDRVPEGGVALLNAILTDVHRELAGGAQPDDLTLLTSKVLGE